MTPGLTETGPYEGRVQSSHVRRKAIVYVRQSTPGQVERNRESTLLQYGLTDRVRQLGWAEASTEIIDDDLGNSARYSGTRKGFMTLVWRGWPGPCRDYRQQRGQSPGAEFVRVGTLVGTLRSH